MSDHGFVCQVDHLICHEGALFGYGWALVDHARFHDGVLLLAFDDGRSVSVQVSINRERKDVSAVYPPRAFFRLHVYGRVEGERPRFGPTGVQGG